MVQHGLAREMAEAGFAEIRRVSKYQGTMQVVTASP
jgi:hypothetical protein